MDNDAFAAGSTHAGPPADGPFPASVEPRGPGVPSTGAMAARDGNDRNGVFRHLVKEDADIAGLVAYSIYKQNKLDWLTAFEKTKGRPPDDAEMTSYIIGEGTPRRLATYRHLAEATLAGKGPEVAGRAGRGGLPFRRAGLGEAGGITPVRLAAYAAVAVLALIGVWLAAHFTMASR